MWRWLGRMLAKLLAWVIAKLVKMAALAALWATTRTVRWAWRHPRTTTLAAGAAGAAFLAGPIVVAATVVALVLVGAAWRLRWPDSFEAVLGRWLRVWWRRWWRYRRVWRRVMSRCGLSVGDGDTIEVPRLRRVHCTRWWDTLEVELRVGQEFADLQAVRGKLARGLSTTRLDVVWRDGMASSRALIQVMRRDPFRDQIIAPAPIPSIVADIDFRALPVGVDEHGDPMMVSVVGGHTVISGSTGGGKAGLEWGVLRQLAPAIAEDIVRPVLIDPKRMELSRARSIAAPEDYASDGDAAVRVLQRLVGEMAAAQDQAAEAGDSDFVPSRDRPLRLICIDELAAALHYWKRSLRTQVEELLGLLLTQGRATGHIVVGCIQEPTKDIFPVRDLFSRRIALRLPTSSHTDAALCDDASDRGALCTAIPESLPGVGYSFRDGAPVAQRVRLGYCDRDAIAELVAFIEAHRAEVRGSLTASHADAVRVDELAEVTA